MPVVRIAMRAGKTDAHIQAIADGVHRALVESYEVREGDRFQLIDLYEPNRLIYDPTFVAGPRSEDFVLISVAAGPRDRSTKEAFMAQVVQELAKAPGLASQDIMVLLSATTAPEDLSFGDGISAATLLDRLQRR